MQTIAKTKTKLIINRSTMGNVFGKTYIMGMVFGKIVVETPKYTVAKSGDGYEVREYPPAVSAEVTYDPSEFKGDKDGGFQVLAKYIGVFGKPENQKIAMASPVVATEGEKIAMTSPVITKEGEKIAMTSPVITKEGEKIAMTSPVVTKEVGGGERKKKTVTMQFLLPEMYKRAEDAPRPTDERVVIREEGGRKYGVVTFSGTAGEGVVSEKVKKLTSVLERDGFKIVGEFVLARYNPPWTLPPFRTNEVMIPVE
ncbi:heme-binding-like protein At3g10130, chloroplastic [Brassica napus]|uniref:heme-binding-like protein At3g10130, chloroplastic n=1 Tax=Brassica napus TaxID=3708 RepID=UPI0006AAB8A9|nr:heme-binding-like protein At3g10130, chloroplastic [Brassica napus]